jgi:hypothetical protein
LQKFFFIGFWNLFRFWSLSEINQIKTIQFDRIINALFNYIKKKKFSSFAEIQYDWRKWVKISESSCMRNLSRSRQWIESLYRYLYAPTNRTLVLLLSLPVAITAVSLVYFLPSLTAYWLFSFCFSYFGVFIFLSILSFSLLFFFSLSHARSTQEEMK